MTTRLWHWLSRPFGAPTFSPAGLLQWAAIIAAPFLLCHAAGLREHTTILSGTSPTGDVGSTVAVALGAVYVLAYFAFVIVVPVLLLASLICLILLLVTSRPLKRHGKLFALAGVLLVLVAVSHCPGQQQGAPAAEQDATKRPAEWAQPIKLPGCPNLHKVSDTLYRGAQPTAEGMKQLEKLGIKTVVDLRSFHSDRDLLKGTALRYESISMNAWHAENEDIVRFLKIVTDKKAAPVFVHCQHGSDRTGTACAVYRIAVEGWTKEAAAREMTEGGYGFHEVWQNLLDYVGKLDLDAIKRKAGLAPAGK